MGHLSIGVILLIILGISVQYKMLIIAPDVSNSHIIWSYRVAETLKNAGHSVVILRHKPWPTKTSKHNLVDGVEGTIYVIIWSHVYYFH
ncbi:hypothetical protein AB6A40_011333 [Gnathostoma spinigerum]|uniref:Uncharacterized protein n=1 Tax=Gnathostoma spinigerum TaxID=75299 RepID=A0ABD6F1K3_9BILA